MNTCSHKKDGKQFPTWVLVDARGIYVAKVCDLCIEAVRRGYNPWVWTGYNQGDVDEQIDLAE